MSVEARQSLQDINSTPAISDKKNNSSKTLLPEGSLDMAKRIAGKFNRHVPSRLHEDVEADALLGLVEASQNFDHSIERPFEGFAPQRIRGAIIDGLRRGDILSRRDRRAVNDSRDTENPLPNPQAVGIEKLDNVPNDDISAEEALDQGRKIHKIKQAVSQLEERDRKLIDLYVIQDKSFKEAGKELGVTESRAFQLYKRAVKRLKEKLEGLIDAD